MMEKLFQYSHARISTINLGFKRYLWDKMDWRQRLIAITGPRGIGKTTFLLQYIHEHLHHDTEEVLFVNADDLYFAKNTLVDFADNFVKNGGKYLFIDEIHKYKDWSREIKNIYDYFSDLQLVITGSSALDIYKGQADLSRRAISYKMHGLSFREFIDLKYQIKLPVLTLEEIIDSHVNIATDISSKLKPVKLFKEYLQHGYYPFFVEGLSQFSEKLRQTVVHVLETDLPSVERIDYNSIHHLKKLLSIIAEIVPYKPNISKLSQQVEVSRESLVKYLYLLSQADLLLLLQTGKHGISKMNKPEKIFLHNPNLVHTLADINANEGNIRETFFYNQLNATHSITQSETSDFLVNDRYTFEIGGKNKKNKQIRNKKEAYIVADNIEFGMGNKIPIWLFGFLY